MTSGVSYVPAVPQQSELTLRQISTCLPCGEGLEAWVSRQIVALGHGHLGPSTLQALRLPSKPERPTAPPAAVNGYTEPGVTARRADTAIYFVHGSGYGPVSPAHTSQLTSVALPA